MSKGSRFVTGAAGVGAIGLLASMGIDIDAFADMVVDGDRVNDLAQIAGLDGADDLFDGKVHLLDAMPTGDEVDPRVTYHALEGGQVLAVTDGATLPDLVHATGDGTHTLNGVVVSGNTEGLADAVKGYNAYFTPQDVTALSEGSERTIEALNDSSLSAAEKATAIEALKDAAVDDGVTFGNTAYQQHMAIANHVVPAALSAAAGGVAGAGTDSWASKMAQQKQAANIAAQLSGGRNS